MHLQFDTDSIRSYGTANHTKLHTDKTGLIACTRKIYAINYNDKVCDKCITPTHFNRDLGVFLDSEILFHHQVDYLYSHSKC